MKITNKVLSFRGAWLVAMSVVWIILFSGSVNADEIGLSTCGKPIMVRGSFQHYTPSSPGSVTNATDINMYSEEVYGKDFTAVVEGLDEGTYTIEVYVAEQYHAVAAARVFNIYYGDTLIKENLDPFAEVGKNAEYKFTHEVSYSPSDNNNELSIRFETITDNGKFNAIRILDSNLDPIACVMASELSLDIPLGVGNPFVRDLFTADPSAHVFEDKMYVYPSHDKDNANGFDMRDYHVFSSSDLSTWEDHGVALDVDDVPWATEYMWAPDCVYKDGTYYFYFPAKDSAGEFRIGVATSQSPSGPFVPEAEPMAGSFSVDPAVFVDDDGQAYMYFGGDGHGGQTTPWVAKLDGTMKEFSEAPQALTGINYWFEACWMNKIDGVYYLSYSTGTKHPSYPSSSAIAYATSTDPMGPFTYQGVVNGYVSGWTNHHSIVEYKGQSYFFYHNSDLSGGDMRRRSVAADYIHFNDDGSIQQVTQTGVGIGRYDGLARIEAENYSETGGVEKYECNEGGFLVSMDPNDMLVFNNIELGETEPSVLKLRVASISTDGAIEIHATSGELLGSVEVANTGDLESWETVTAKIQPLSGNEGITLTYVGTGTSTVHLNWIEFEDRSVFDKDKDLLLAQFDSKPDADDIHAQAALGSMLAHSDLGGVNYFAVAGAIGTQSGTYIHSKGLFTLAFGAENTNWTDANADWSGSVTRIKEKVRTVLDAGGKVWVQEAGQSNITADWIAALISDGVDETLIKENVIVVQHSDWNEGKTASSDLTYVKAKATYVAIDDGNANPGDYSSRGYRGPETPNYTSSSSSYLINAKSDDNTNAHTKALWTEADRIIDESGFNASYSLIPGGGVDYSDCSENWWIFNIGSDAGTARAFWNRYVVEEPDVVVIPPSNSNVYLEAGGLVVMDVESTPIVSGWVEGTSIDGYLGSSYYTATTDSFNTPGSGVLEYPFQVANAGDYQLQWRSRITQGTSFTDFNDNFARLVDASGTPVVPVANDLVPTGSEQWHKVYMNKVGVWIWDAKNHDNNPKAIAWDLQAGETYTLQVSYRSKGHGIDRLMLWNRTGFGHSFGNLTGAASNTATMDAVPLSEFVPGVSSVTFDALSDFDISSVTSGEVPYYIDNDRGALAIDASNPSYRGKFGGATLSEVVPAGTYDVTIETMRELDGECEYQLYINGQLIGTKVNSTTTVDYAVQEHVFSGVTIPANAEIVVKSNVVSNEKIPEGGGWAFARGRWTTLNFTSATDSEDVEASFTNISTRAFVTDGNGVVIGGLAFEGTEPMLVLIQGVGSELGEDPFGVGEALMDTQLTLYKGDDVIATNDDWDADSALASDIEDAGVVTGSFVLLDGGKSAAILMELDPGIYTVQLNGKDGALGVGLLEVYNVSTKVD